MDKPSVSLKEKLHSETALIEWNELQRFFAKGVVVVIDDSLDLIDIAVMFAEDKAGSLSQHTDSGRIAARSGQPW